jgi:predicted phosphoadenosine phosphosulfate sulfurtransferase
MVDRVPGAAAAARYALTELYGFSQRPDKPPGVAWPDFIVRYLGKHPPDIAAQVADRIKDKIRRHYHQCILPILPDTPCPETGLSWNWLLGIAMRGDFKGRKHEKHRIVLEADGTRPVAAWRRYLAELEALTAAGTVTEIAYPYRLPADLATLLPDYARKADG